jgi:ubiquinone/menaquinone biosynthesis C-methylase UbiE
MIDYEKETLNAYKTPERAAEYKKFHTKEWSWGRFVTWREQKVMKRELKRYTWSDSDKLLDIPCGTGILGKLLHDFPFKIVASDISEEMMELAQEEYPTDRFIECKQSDITDTKFPRNMFSCTICLGFLHRVPSDVKEAALKEIFAVTNKIAIVSCSVDTPLQRIKHFAMSKIKRNHIPAPCPEKLSKIINECESQGFKVAKIIKVVPILSAHTLLFLEK